MASPLLASSAAGLASSPLRMMGAQSSTPSGGFFGRSGFGNNFSDVAGGIRNITRNFAAGFGQDPNTRAIAQQGLDQEAAQQDASKRQILEWTFKNMESLAAGVQGNPQALAAIQPYLEKSAANLQKLGLPQEQIDETLGYFQAIAQMPAAAKDYQPVALYNPVTKETISINGNDPAAVQDAQTRGFTAPGSAQSSDVLSPEAQQQKIDIAQQSRPPAQPRSPSDMELAAIWLNSDNPELVAAGKHKLGLSGGENDPQNAATLRGQYLGQVKDFQTVRQNYQVVKAAEDTGAGDIARVFGYMKLLDPSSTVREGEAATAQNAAGVPESIRGQWNNLIGGGQLSKEARTQIASQVDILYKTYEKQQKTTQKQFSEIAKGLKIDPKLVVTEQTSEDDGEAADFATMTAEDLLAVDVSKLTPEQLDAYNAALQKAIGGP